MRILLLLVLLLNLSIVSSALATEQIGDILIVNDNPSEIEANPLEFYLDNKGNREFGDIILYGDCTANWRGYVAEWTLEYDSIFLVNIILDACSDNPKSYDVSKEFGKQRIHANWINQTITYKDGKSIQHGIYTDDIHEGETLYSFKNGVLVETNKFTFVEYKLDCVFPGNKYLKDTLSTLIINNIPKDHRNNFDQTQTTELSIEFNSQGKLEEIHIISSDKKYSVDERILLQTAKKALQGFPLLMPVNHPRYEPQHIRVNFNGYCIVNNLYEKDGCDRY